jgi:heme/copper-type cytochrome/quinol oxidase subunit 2
VNLLPRSETSLSTSENIRTFDEISLTTSETNLIVLRIFSLILIIILMLIIILICFQNSQNPKTNPQNATSLMQDRFSRICIYIIQNRIVCLLKSSFVLLIHLL